MLYTQNGNLGKLSVMGLGCWNFGGQWNKVEESDAIEIIRYAIDNGINYVDVAESYGVPDGQCEMILGKALKEGYREKVFLVSKVGWYGRRTADCFNAKDSIYTKLMRKVFNKLNHFKPVDFASRTPEIVRLSGHACCGRLGTDHIDLLLCHDGNPKEPEAFIEGFRMLKKEGFIKHYGISTNSIDVLKHFYELSNGECEACECDYSLLHRNAENDIFKFCKEHNIAILTRGTLCRGLLSGKYDLNTVFKESSRQDWNVGGRNRMQYELYIKQIEKYKSTFKDSSLTQISYRFAFSKSEHPSVVIGCTNMEQIKQNINIASEYLTESEIRCVDRIMGYNG